MKAQTLKGFRDYLPEQANAREFVVEKIKETFKKFGFDPLETPTLEYEEVLAGKYGEEERLIYKFETAGKDKVALKYDQTVPLARIIAQYGPKGQQVLPMPFKRYQIQPAFRGENPQKGRYREFLQCDADIIGVASPLADAEILALVYEIYKNLGLDVVIKINDRSLLSRYDAKALATVDKLNKITEAGVVEELKLRGFSDAESILKEIKSLKVSENLDQILTVYQKMGYPDDSVRFDPMLVRGLDYYTGLILEVVLRANPTSSSLGGGGRWDQMIGKFTGVDLPAVGYSVGLDRTIEAMAELGILQSSQTSTQVLITIFSPDLSEKSLEIASKLREANINTELYLDPEAKLDKQLKYADQKQIPFVVIIGPDEVRENKVTLKNLNKKSQEVLTADELIKKF